MPRLIGIRAVSRIVIASAMCASLACQTPASTTNATATSSPASARPESQPDNGPVRDLRRDEASGGHILRKHVGQTEQQLRDRLAREPNITGASTYTDLSTAEHAVGAAIAQAQDQIQTWLNRSGRRTNLVLDYDSPFPLGRSMDRGEVHSRVCQHAVVVLKYTGPNRYYVLTSYPECRS